MAVRDEPGALIDREFAQVLYRALRMILAWLEKTYGFGKEHNHREDG